MKFYTHFSFFFCWRRSVSRIINQMLLCWLKFGRTVDRKRLRIHSNIVGCFCFAENRGMLPSIELLVFLLNELDVIVIVINRRLFLCLWRISVFIVIFPFCGGIKRISALTYDCFSSVVVLLLLYSTNGSCWWIMHVTDIVVSWKLGSNCIVYISKPVDVVGFELIRWNLFARFA